MQVILKGDHDLCVVCCWEYQGEGEEGGCVRRQPRLDAAAAPSPACRAPAASAEQQRAQTPRQSPPLPAPGRPTWEPNPNKSRLRKANVSKRGNSFRAQVKTSHVGCVQLCHENLCQGHVYNTHVHRFIFKCKEMCCCYTYARIALCEWKHTWVRQVTLNW